MGRFFICSEASSSYSPPLTARRAVINLAAVPALPTFILALLFGILPPHPFTVISFFSLSALISIPRILRQLIKSSESLENKAFFITEVPEATAATRRARFVMLLLPGTLTRMFLLVPYIHFTR